VIFYNVINSYFVVQREILPQVMRRTQIS